MNMSVLLMQLTFSDSAVQNVAERKKVRVMEGCEGNRCGRSAAHCDTAHEQNELNFEVPLNKLM